MTDADAGLRIDGLDEALPPLARRGALANELRDLIWRRDAGAQGALDGREHGSDLTGWPFGAKALH